MSRYVRRPKAYWSEQVEEEILEKHLTVFDEPFKYTGLLDAQGNELVRVREPIGFKVR